MRVGLLIDRYRPRGGGAEAYLAELAVFLRERGDEPLLLSMDEAGETFPGRSVPIPGRRLPRGWRELAFARGCREALRRERVELSLAVRDATDADIFQPHGGAVAPAWEARLEALPPGRRLAGKALRAIDLKRAVFIRLERRLVVAARRVLAVSRASAEEFRALYPEHRGKIASLPLGVDCSRFRPDGDRAQLGGSYALFVGHDFRLKGLAACLEALAALRRRGRNLIFAVLGRGGSADRWREEARRLGIGNAVRFLGEAADPAPYYRGAEILLHPTFYDPCSRVALEALACGLPVVTTRRNGASEVGGEGLGLVDDPRDVEGLVRAAENLLNRRRDGRRSLLPETRAAERHFQELRTVMGELAPATSPS